MRLQHKVAIITGAGGGMGRATARLFLQEGAKVVAADYQSGGLEQLPAGPDLATVTGDVSARPDAERIVAVALERFGRVDVLCNVAGIMDRFLPVGELTDELWNRVLAVNLTGPMNMIRAALPTMLTQGGGAIVNISSVGGLFGGRAGAAYVASKHGLIGLTKNVAVTYGKDGIRCVVVCPGAVNTGISIGGEPSPRGFEALNRSLPANPRTAEPDELARIILFLASDEASFVNGAALVADGGWTAV
jgi:NAD(P)-dependent dehydrogenase (short-subunit alcohol dehydrogenase family)